MNGSWGGERRLNIDAVKRPRQFAGFDVRDERTLRQPIGKLLERYLQYLRQMANVAPAVIADKTAARQPEPVLTSLVVPPLRGLNPTEQPPIASLSLFIWRARQFLARSRIELHYRYTKLRQAAVRGRHRVAAWGAAAVVGTRRRVRRAKAPTLAWAALPALLIGGIFALILFLLSPPGPVANPSNTKPGQNPSNSLLTDRSNTGQAHSYSGVTIGEATPVQQPPSDTWQNNSSQQASSQPTGIDTSGYSPSGGSPSSSTGETAPPATSTSSGSLPQTIDLPPVSLELGGKQIISTSALGITLN